MKKVFKAIQENFDLRRQYFIKAETDITEKNLNLLKTFSLCVAALLVLFFLVTPSIITGWEITLQHILFLPAMLISFAVALIFKKLPHNFRIVTYLCAGFECIMYIFVILIDVLPLANAPSAFFPMLCIALTVCFILKYRISYTIMIFFEAVYIVCVLYFKDPFIAQYDIFNSVASVVFSILLSHIIMRLHIKDYGLNLKYKNLSMQDPLCPVLNKKACHDAIRSYFDAYNPYVECSMLFLDMDDFKDINDTYGHFVGDRILKILGDVLAASFRSTDIIGRIGGDEFMVLLKAPSGFNLLEAKCMLINTRLLDAIASAGLPAVSLSIGAVAVQREEVDFDVLFKKADNALYHAKELGRGQFVLRTYQDANEAEQE